MARSSLSTLGSPGTGLLQVDKEHISVNPDTHLIVDSEVHEERLRSALKAEPGIERYKLLVLALAEVGTLLENEPFAE